MDQPSIEAAKEATARLPPGTTILQILPALRHGGVERGTIEIADAIVQAGGRALVASSGGPNVAVLERVGGEHILLPMASKNPFTVWANAATLSDLISREAVSLVHARSRAPAWSAKWAARRSGIPFVTTFHGAYSEGFPLKRWYNSVMASGDRVIAISYFLADLIRARHGTPQERLRVIHRGVDQKTFRPGAVGFGRLLQLQRQWGLNEESRVVLMPGRLTRLKGHGVLVEAMDHLRSKGRQTDVSCVLLGDDAGRSAYRQELERRVQRLKLENQVIFAKHTDDMPAALQMAEVVVSASTEPEGFGRTLAEAAAMGKPVIATNHGGAAEVVAPGQTGWLVEPGSAAKLAEALDAALSLTGTERAALAKKAIERTRSMFSRESMCRNTVAVYNELLRG